MAFLKNLKQMQKVNWGMQYLWDIKFTDPELIGPFNEWFPASQINLDLFNLQSYQFQTNIGTVSIPANKIVGDNSFTVTFFDDETGSIEEWLEDWVEQSMFYKDQRNNYSVVGTLDECCRIATVKRLTSKKTDIKTQTGKDWTRDIAIFPEGGLTFVGESEVGIHTYNMTFKIAGYLNPNHY